MPFIAMGQGRVEQGVDETEREHAELIKGFLSHFPAPTELSNRDKSFVIAHIDNNPRLKQFAHKGLQRFLVNSSMCKLTHQEIIGADKCIVMQICFALIAVQKDTLAMNGQE